MSRLLDKVRALVARYTSRDRQEPATPPRHCSLIAHCDWSATAKRRWMAVARRDGDTWAISVPELVGDTATLIDRLRARQTVPGALVIGFDFPIGLPSRYGERTGFGNFRDALGHFGSNEWSRWFEVCAEPEEVSIHRPFYPVRPGGTRRQHLLDGLGVTNADELLRRCERATEARQAACMLFWTLGGNQVGKAAIAGWREILVPQLAELRIWPFDGDLADLLATSDVVVAETYPGEVYGQIGIPRRPVWSKRRQSDRKELGRHLLDWMARRPVVAEPGVTEIIDAGFSGDGAGEDQFDAVVGLFGMIDVVDGRRAEGAPKDEDVRRWEGWILGAGR